MLGHRPVLTHTRALSHTYYSPDAHKQATTHTHKHTDRHPKHTQAPQTHAHRHTCAKAAIDARAGPPRELRSLGRTHAANRK